MGQEQNFLTYFNLTFNNNYESIPMFFDCEKHENMSYKAESAFNGKILAFMCVLLGMYFLCWSSILKFAKSALNVMQQFNTVSLS